MTTVTKSKYQPLTQMRLKGHPVSQQLSAVLPEPQSNPAVKCFTELVQKPVILQWEIILCTGGVPRVGQVPNTTIRKPNHSQGDMLKCSR